MYHEHKELKCPICGDVAELTPWKPPSGIDPRFREYRCTRHTCRNVFYTAGIYHIEKRTP